MVSTISEFKQTASKVVTLPSGLQVKIRKIWMIDFIDLGELPFPASNENGSKSDLPDVVAVQQRVHRLSARVIARGVVDPPFSDRDEDLGREDTAHYRYLSPDDFDFLTAEILKFSGFSKEVKAEADSFRIDGIGGDDKADGGDLRKASDGDS